MRRRGGDRTDRWFMNNYPVPGHTGNHRLTLDLVTDVRAVLVKHGYPELTYDDLNLLRAMLARFIYAPYTAAGAKAGGGAARWYSGTVRRRCRRCR